jgi:hypothetical protein
VGFGKNRMRTSAISILVLDDSEDTGETGVQVVMVSGCERVEWAGRRVVRRETRRNRRGVASTPR